MKANWLTQLKRAGASMDLGCWFFLLLDRFPAGRQQDHEERATG